VTALLIVGHGTRDEEGAAQFRAFTQRVGVRAAARSGSGSGPASGSGSGSEFGSSSGYPGSGAGRESEPASVDGVAGGFIELSAPPVRDAVAQLVAQGRRDVVAVPLILLAAGHAKGDIPAALARERLRHPGLRTRYARPLGVHPVVLELLRERLAESAQPRPDAVLLVGRGTTDPDANADLHRAARLFWETTRDLGVELVEPAFVSLARPSVAEGLERLRRLGARRVTVLPYFLFAGVLPARIVAQSAEAAQRSGLEVCVAPVIGDCDALADLVLERYAEAARGPIAANCDACVYRIAMPGFEHRVGAAQHPHDHPDDPSQSHGHPHSHAHAHAHSHAHGHDHVDEHGHGHVDGGHALSPEPVDKDYDSPGPRHTEASSVR
jgi:sirohydrochlorin cobaltochelatase